MIVPGAPVEHAEFGLGEVVTVFGGTATVDFFGEKLDVDVSELLLRAARDGASVLRSGQTTTDLAFRRSFEAVNLGVVPVDPEQLVKLTIGGEQVSEDIRRVLLRAANGGAYRAFMGYYGSGKSHHLRLVRAIALREGWVTATVELDPKAADPAKPSTVYQELLASIQFPMRADGSRSEDFFDLIKEMRDEWNKVRSGRYFRSSPWFSKGVAALQYLSHRRDDIEYVTAVNWLAGQVKQISAIRSAVRHAGYRDTIPTMPNSKDTGVIYAFHLVVLHHALQALGYRGLAIIVDEAEHVRTYSLGRYVKANNFLDVLARCAHRPRTDVAEPPCDHDISDLPPFWREGPHFALFVGLTEGEWHERSQQDAADMSVLIHSPEDVARLEAPSPKAYEAWSEAFLAEAAQRLGPKVISLSDAALRHRIARTLRERFEEIPGAERLLRNWTKLAGFPAAVLMSQPREIRGEELVSIVDAAAREVAGEVHPWDG